LHLGLYGPSKIMVVFTFSRKIIVDNNSHLGLGPPVAL
jgi:hypothetical protein